MIELIENLPSKAPNCAAEVRIHSLFNAYGNGKLAYFWQQSNDKGESTAIISKMDNALTLCAYKNADIDEIEQFISVVGAQSVLSNVPLCISGEKVLWQLYYEPQSADKIEINSPNYKQAYDIMLTRFDMPPYEVWYPDVCHRVRHHTACLLSNDTAALCGLLGGSRMLVVGLCSTPACKGQGTATKLLKKAIGSNLAQRYIVLAEEELIQYYVNQDFVPSGNHYTYGDV